MLQGAAEGDSALMLAVGWAGVETGSSGVEGAVA